MTGFDRYTRNRALHRLTFGTDECMLRISLHGYSAIEHPELESRLIQIVTVCRGWVLEERPFSTASYYLRFEVELNAIPDLYSSLQAADLHLMPVAHRALTEMCLCRHYLSGDEDIQIVSVDLHIGRLGCQPLQLRRFVRPHPA